MFIGFIVGCGVALFIDWLVNSILKAIPSHIQFITFLRNTIRVLVASIVIFLIMALFNHWSHE